MKKQETEIAIEAVSITDSDLLEQFEQAQGFEPRLRQMMEGRIRKTQAERNEAQKRRATMTPIQRRRDIISEQLEELQLQESDVHHIHSVLALCALPYKRPKQDMEDYHAKYGLMSLNVQPGSLIDPNNGNWVKQGVPYGPKARLMQLHICTKALRQKSPEVELEDSMSGFIRSLGFSVTGGKNGTIAIFKEQLNRLAACRLQIGLWDGKNRAKTINLNPIKSFEVWFPDDPLQKMLWPSKVVLSNDFYESLVEHALPVNIHALSALSHSAKQMDLMLWISYRFKALLKQKKTYLVTWEILREQFCQSEGMREIDFEKQFHGELEHLREVFNKKPLPLNLSDKGLLLHPCDPEDLFVPPKKLTGKRH